MYLKKEHATKQKENDMKNEVANNRRLYKKQNTTSNTRTTRKKTTKGMEHGKEDTVHSKSTSATVRLQVKVRHAGERNKS